MLSPVLVSFFFFFSFFFFNATATPEIYTLSLHDALPILGLNPPGFAAQTVALAFGLAAASIFPALMMGIFSDRKSTRLNSSHQIISYAVFCLKKQITWFASINERCPSFYLADYPVLRNFTSGPPVPVT